mmetsp:Transcript_2529/g.7700  ORF Transcript_2529/g.7700 Transcript_2529/m.7700 type:complete len:200 (+) Transcript_2529:410-1009(+)
MEAEDLQQDLVLNVALTQLVVGLAVVEHEHAVAHRLIVRLVQGGQVRMAQGLVDRDAIVRVELQHLLEEVQSLAGSGWVQCGHPAPAPQRLVSHKTLGFFAPDKVHIRLRWRPDDVGDELELVDIVLAGKEWLASEQLREDAAHGPDIDCLGVFAARKHDLRGTVPARDHILGECELSVLEPAGEPEVAHLEIAVGVEE